MSENTDRITTINNIVGTLLPGGDASRSKALLKTLTSLPSDYLPSVQRAIVVAFAERKFSVIRDALESGNLMTIDAAEKWGRIVNVDNIEAELSLLFGDRDEPYDVYSPVFDAHVEAYATYHAYCEGDCAPQDRDIEYSELDATDAPADGHYLNYLQDYELMELVEEHSKHVTTLVKFAAVRRGVDPELVSQLLAPEASVLVEGLL